MEIQRMDELKLKLMPTPMPMPMPMPNNHRASNSFPRLRSKLARVSAVMGSASWCVRVVKRCLVESRTQQLNDDFNHTLTQSNKLANVASASAAAAQLFLKILPH